MARRGCRPNGGTARGISDPPVGAALALPAVNSVRIGQGVDAARFDPATDLAFASNGEGTLTIVHEDSPDHLTVVQTLTTARSARTMTLDPTTHKLYVPAADYEARQRLTPGDRDAGHHWLPVRSGCWCTARRVSRTRSGELSCPDECIFSASAIDPGGLREPQRRCVHGAAVRAAITWRGPVADSV